MRLRSPSDTTHRRGPAVRRRRERLLLAGGSLFLAIVVILLLQRPHFKQITSGPERIRCGAEKQRKDHFVSDGYEFSGAQYRSGQHARNGRYSIALPADGNTHYGFTIALDDVQAGAVYEVTVWSYNNNGSGKLAVQGTDPTGLYQDTAETHERDRSGWEQHRLRFHLPFDHPPGILKIYVYSTGSHEIFFDDLLIEKVSQWDPQVFQPTRLNLRLDRAAEKKLNEKRDDALSRGILQTGDDDWVDGTLTENDTTYDIRLRLKGDWLDHLRGDKWSYRIKLRDQRAWRGMRTFSLHTPAARYYLHEWLLHRFWQSQGVLTTRYDFVEVLVNGQSRGIYAYEEHFEKQLVEAQQRREGPIVKFSEDGFWATIARQLDHHGFVRPGAEYSAERMENAPATAFQQDELQADPTRAPLLRQALLQLESYRTGAAPAAEIFDLQLLARYYAGCDLFNAYHGLVWHNQRFYYNPVTTKLEPIGFDGFAEAPSRRYHFLAEGTLHRNAPESTSLPAFLLRDTAFVRAYLQAVEQLSRPETWQDFFTREEAGWTARLQWLRQEFPNYSPEPATLTDEVAFVRSHLLPFRENVLRSYRAPAGELWLENTHTLPVIIHGFSTGTDAPVRELSTPLWLPAGPVRNRLSKLATTDAPVAFRSLNFWDEQALASQTTPHFERVKVPAAARYLYLQIPGWDTLIATPINPLPFPDQDNIVGRDYRRGSKAADFPTLRWDTLRRTITIPPGTHRLAQDLIVPSTYRLLLQAGADVQLTERTAIISYGAVRALGEEETPITIRDGDGTGQGLQVIQAATGSILRNVTFQGLHTLSKGDWQLTGAVTFYESAVQIVACRFLDNRSEDALNLVRCEFEMQHCLIQNTSSDGLDADFCKGRISQSHFRETTNDGVDFSGSIITLEDVELHDCGDKGVSAGEASDITIKNTRISGCHIGLASKDRSTLYVRRGRMSDCPLGMAVFQKKPEFGPAYLLIEEVVMENIERLYQIGPGSRLQIDEQTYD